MTTGLDFWLENGPAHVGSPETVAKRLEKQHQLIGFDVFCGRHRFGEIASPLVEKSIRPCFSQPRPTSWPGIPLLL